MIFSNEEAFREASRNYLRIIYKYWICKASLQEIKEHVAGIELSEDCSQRARETLTQV